MMARHDNAREDFVRNLIGKKVADITATKNRLVESALMLSGKGVANIFQFAVSSGRKRRRAWLRASARFTIASGRGLACRLEGGLEIGLIGDFLDVFDVNDFVVFIDHEDYAGK